MSQNVINTIIANELCIGCGICAGICPQNALVMKFNEYGEYVPYLENNCLEGCRLCLHACPFHDNNENVLGTSLYGNTKDIKYLSETGYYLDSFVGYSSDFRPNSASGGMATWLLTTLLRENVVDYVITVNANKDPDQLFQYTIFDDEKSILTSSGSVYYPVEMSQVIKTILDKPGRYAIVGLPCFLKGLRLASQKNKKLKERITVTVGLVCGQMKSTHYTAYLSTLANAGGKLQKVNYRGKSPDKPANNYYFHCINENGDEGTIFLKDGVAEAWVNRWFTPNACNFCDDVFAELADVVFMDAWLPEYSSDSRGTNLAIVRTPFINDLILKCSKEKLIDIDNISIEKVIESQQGVIDLKQKSLAYRLYLAKKNGLKVPVKRVEMSNKMIFFKRQEIKLKCKMQKASKTYFIEAYVNGAFNITDFRINMRNLVNKTRTQRFVQKVISFPRQIIEKLESLKLSLQ